MAVSIQEDRAKYPEKRACEQLKKKKIDEASPEIKKVLRRAGDMDIQKWKENK